MKDKLVVKKMTFERLVDVEYNVYDTFHTTTDMHEWKGFHEWLCKKYPEEDWNLSYNDFDDEEGADTYICYLEEKYPGNKFGFFWSYYDDKHYDGDGSKEETCYVYLKETEK